MSELPECPRCQSPYAYESGHMYVCPECSHEWSPEAEEDNGGQGTAGAGKESSGEVVRDAHGTPLEDGDTVTLIKDLKVKGSSSVLKIGMRVKGIRLVEGDHDIDCSIDGIGSMKLRSEFVKKASG